MFKVKHLYIDKKLFLSLVSICLCFCIITSTYTTFLILNDIKKDINYQSTILKKEIISALDTAKHILKGLSLTITPYDNSKYPILKNFDLKNYHNSKLRFSALVITNKQNESIASSTLLPEQFYKKNFRQAKCLENTQKYPHVVQIGKISQGIYSGIKILPLGIGLTDTNGTYQGSICTGLEIDNLNYFLKQSTNQEVIKNISIEYTNNTPLPPNISNFDLLQRITNYKSDQIRFPLGIKNYSLNTLLNKNNIQRTIYQKLLIHLATALFLIFIIGILHYFIKHSFMTPLSNIKNKLLELSTHNKNKIFNITEEHLFSTINSIILENKNIYDTQKQKLKKQKQEFLEKQLLYSALLERNYTPTSFQEKFDEAYLIKKTLYHISKDKKQHVIILNSINNIIDYCREYFEIEISILSFIENNHKIKLNYHAFEESIFLLILFILRSGFYTETQPIKITVNRSTPKDINITIEAKTCPDQRSITWENHPVTPFSSLNTVLLLLKENNLFLNVYKKNKTLFFSFSTIH